MLNWPYYPHKSCCTWRSTESARIGHDLCYLPRRLSLKSGTIFWSRVYSDRLKPMSIWLYSIWRRGQTVGSRVSVDVILLALLQHQMDSYGRNISWEAGSFIVPLLENSELFQCAQLTTISYPHRLVIILDPMYKLPDRMLNWIKW